MVVHKNVSYQSHSFTFSLPNTLYVIFDKVNDGILTNDAFNLLCNLRMRESVPLCKNGYEIVRKLIMKFLDHR